MFSSEQAATPHRNLRLSLAHLAVHDDLVIDAKLALWHPGKVGLHQDLGGGKLGHHKGTVINIFMAAIS